MPVLQIQCRLPRRNGVPEDDAVNVWCFDTDQTVAEDADDIVDRLDTFYGAIQTYLAQTLSGAMIAKVYNLADAQPRPVVYTSDEAFTPNNAVSALPAELAIKTTFIGRDPGGMPIQYRRGGVYLGPLNSSVQGTSQAPVGDIAVDPAVCTAIGVALTALAKGPDAGDGRLAVYSPTWHKGRGPTSGGAAGGRAPLPALAPHTLDEATNDVVSGWVDNAFDIQRRRGSEATARTTFAVADQPVGVRSKRLFGPTGLLVNTVVYTVPAGETAILKTIVVSNNTAADAVVSLRTPGTTDNDRIFQRTVAPGAAVDFPVWLVVHAGEAVQARTFPLSANVRVSGHGAELEGAADQVAVLGTGPEFPLAQCVAGELATAAVTVIAGLGAAAVLIVQAFRRDPPFRANVRSRERPKEDDPDG